MEANKYHEAFEYADKQKKRFLSVQFTIKDAIAIGGLIITLSVMYSGHMGEEIKLDSRISIVERDQQKAEKEFKEQLNEFKIEQREQSKKLEEIKEAVLRLQPRYDNTKNRSH